MERTKFTARHDAVDSKADTAERLAAARLEFIAAFDDEDRRVPNHLGRDDAA